MNGKRWNQTMWPARSATIRFRVNGEFWAILTESAQATLLGYAARVGARPDGVEAGLRSANKRLPAIPGNLPRGFECRASSEHHRAVVSPRGVRITQAVFAQE